MGSPSSSVKARMQWFRSSNGVWNQSSMSSRCPLISLCLGIGWIWHLHSQMKQSGMFPGLVPLQVSLIKVTSTWIYRGKVRNGYWSSVQKLCERTLDSYVCSGILMCGVHLRLFLLLLFVFLYAFLLVLLSYILLCHSFMWHPPLTWLKICASSCWGSKSFWLFKVSQRKS